MAWHNPDPRAPGSQTNFLIALRTQACFDRHGVIYPPNIAQLDYGDASNGYHFSMPYTGPGVYRVAVFVNPNIGQAAGYVVGSGTGYVGTTDRSKASTDIVTGCTSNAFMVNVPYAPPPNYSKAKVGLVTLLRDNNYTGFKFTITNAQPSTIVHLKFTGCARRTKIVYAADLTKPNDRVALPLDRP